jgi:hypothetical protein
MGLHLAIPHRSNSSDCIPTQSANPQLVRFKRNARWHKRCGTLVGVSEAKPMEPMKKLQITRSVSGQVVARRRPMPVAQIELDDPVRVAHWCRELGVTWLELVIATDRVGPNAIAVRNALRARDDWWSGREGKS